MEMAPQTGIGGTVGAFYTRAALKTSSRALPKQRASWLGWRPRVVRPKGTGAKISAWERNRSLGDYWSRKPYQSGAPQRELLSLTRQDVIVRSV